MPVPKSVTMLIFQIRRMRRHDYTMQHLREEAKCIIRAIEDASDEKKVKMSLLFGGPVHRVDYGVRSIAQPELGAQLVIQGGGNPMDHAEKELNRERLQALKLIFPGLLIRAEVRELV